jgi:hypothetical protein
MAVQEKFANSFQMLLNPSKVVLVFYGRFIGKHGTSLKLDGLEKE